MSEIMKLLSDLKAPIEIIVLIAIAWTMGKMYLMFVGWDKRFAVLVATLNGKLNVLTEVSKDHGGRITTIEAALIGEKK